MWINFTLAPFGLYKANFFFLFCAGYVILVLILYNDAGGRYNEEDEGGYRRHPGGFRFVQRKLPDHRENREKDGDQNQKGGDEYRTEEKY